MTKTRNFRFYGHTFKSYCKPVGHGYEIGFTFEGKPLFVGNFIHKNEATKWWSYFNNEIRSFFNRYEFPQNGPTQWMTKFFSNYSYKCYYAWLDKNFYKYNREYTKAFKKDDLKYKRLKPTPSYYRSQRYAA